MGLDARPRFWFAAVRGMGARRRLAIAVSLVAAAAVTVGLVAALTGSSLWPFGSGPASAAPHARRYLDASACLLTNPQGIAPGTPGAPVWKVMQAASLSTHVMVTYLPDTGPADATVMLSTLMERQCGVIITTGTPAAEVLKAARAARQQKFVLVAALGPVVPAASPNAVIVSPAGAPARIDQAIRAVAVQAQASGS
jgi:hypothetical protein